MRYMRNRSDGRTWRRSLHITARLGWCAGCDGNGRGINSDWNNHGGNMMWFRRKRKQEWRTLRMLDSAPWWRWIKRELPRPSFEGTGRVRLAENVSEVEAAIYAILSGAQEYQIGAQRIRRAELSTLLQEQLLAANIRWIDRHKHC